MERRRCRSHNSYMCGSGLARQKTGLLPGPFEQLRRLIDTRNTTPLALRVSVTVELDDLQSGRGAFPYARREPFAMVKEDMIKWKDGLRKFHPLSCMCVGGSTYNIRRCPQVVLVRSADLAAFRRACSVVAATVKVIGRDSGKQIFNAPPSMCGCAWIMHNAVRERGGPANSNRAVIKISNEVYLFPLRGRKPYLLTF